MNSVLRIDESDSISYDNDSPTIESPLNCYKSLDHADLKNVMTQGNSKLKNKNSLKLNNQMYSLRITRQDHDKELTNNGTTMSINKVMTDLNAAKSNVTDAFLPGIYNV